jgi:hypothetical protein
MTMISSRDPGNRCYVLRRGLGRAVDQPEPDGRHARPHGCQGQETVVRFLPPDIDVPDLLETDRFQISPLTIHNLVKDYDAVVTSRKLSSTTLGQPLHLCQGRASSGMVIPVDIPQVPDCTEPHSTDRKPPPNLTSLDLG